jgi:TonB family protein
MKAPKYLAAILVPLCFLTSNATGGVETNTETISYECDTPPKPIKYFPPRYPPEAGVRHIGGKVIVRCIVTTEGVARDIEVVESYPKGIFEEAAIETVKQYRFIPGTEDCKPADIYVVIPINFDGGETKPRDYYIKYQDGKRQFENNEFEEAILSLSSSIYIYNKYSPAFFFRGLAYRATGNNKKALSDFKRAIRFNRKKAKEAVYYFERGLVYLRMEDLKHALKDFNKAIKFNSDMTDAYFDRGEVFRLSTNYDDAIADYTKVLSLDEEYLQAYINRGYCYKELNNNKNFCTDFKKACELGDCSEYEALKKLGTCSGDVYEQSERIKK